MAKQKYFKITNRKENHFGFQYQDGLNVLVEDFSEKGECCAGGFYFTDIDNIALYLGFGIWLRDVDLPTDDPEFKMVADSSGGKWRANKIILGEKRSLYELDTLKYLESQGASLKDNSYFRLAFRYDDAEMFKFLIDKGCSLENELFMYLESDHPNICQEIVKNRIFTDAYHMSVILNYALYENNIPFMKLILQNYPDAIYVSRFLDYAFRINNITFMKFILQNYPVPDEVLFRKISYALTEQKIDAFKLLLTGTDEFILTSEILCKLFYYCCDKRILNYLMDNNILMSQGIDFGDKNSEIFIESVKRPNIKLIDFLSDKIDAPTKNTAFRAAIATSNLDTVKYLYEKFEIDTSDLEPLLVQVAPGASFDFVKYMIEVLGVDPTYNNNEAVKCAQRHKNKKVASYLARTSSKLHFARIATLNLQEQIPSMMVTG